MKFSEKLMTKISLIIGISGIIILLMTLNNIEKPEDISKLNMNDYGRNTIVKGIVDKIYYKNGYQYVKLKQISEVDVIFNKEIPLKQGSFIEVKGNLNYKNNKKIIYANEIKLLG